MAKLSKIVIHWTAGGYTPNSVDLKHYHYLIDKNGRVNYGIYRPEDNEDCNDGRYAAHTGGGNTGAIGIAFCGMLSYVNPERVGSYPLTKVQCEAGFKFIAEIAKKYNIPVDATRIMTHYEFGKAHPKSTSAGKIDITYLPPYPSISAEDMGEFIRTKIKWYQNK